MRCCFLLHSIFVVVIVWWWCGSGGGGGGMCEIWRRTNARILQRVVALRCPWEWNLILRSLPGPTLSISFSCWENVGCFRVACKAVSDSENFLQPTRVSAYKTVAQGWLSLSFKIKLVRNFFKCFINQGRQLLSVTYMETMIYKSIKCIKHCQGNGLSLHLIYFISLLCFHFFLFIIETWNKFAHLSLDYCSTQPNPTLTPF